MTGPLAYLLVTSARNRIAARVARLRNPRYALAMLLGAAYLWLVYLRPSRHPAAEEPLGGVAVTLMPLATLAFVAWTWLFGGERSALAFSEAEVTMLFSAPVSRRALMLYKIARTQLTILTTSIVWTLVLRQGPTWGSAITHVVSYWVLLSTLNLNRLGVALIRANGGTHGLRGARRNWIAIAIFTAILAMVAVPIAAAWPQLRAADGVSAMADVVTAAIDAPPARWALLPFQLLIAPLEASPGTAWLGTIGPALLLLGGALLWVLRTDATFEEAAADASAAQAQKLDAVRSRRGATSMPVVHPGRTIPLAPTGAPAVALLWKNAMWLIRTKQMRGLLAPPLLAFGCVALFATRSASAAGIIAVACLTLAAFMLLMGPVSMRNDLRSELLHLSLLKTFPLRGRDVVLAEVASGALPLAAMQYLLVLAALLSVGLTDDLRLTAGLGVAIVAAAPLLLAGLNGAVFMIHNGIALLFPGWVRLGADVGGGVETMGLGMITIAIALVALAVLLIVPGAAAALAVVPLRDHPALALLLGGIAGGLLLLAEMVLCARVLGRMLDRVEG